MIFVQCTRHMHIHPHTHTGQGGPRIAVIYCWVRSRYLFSCISCILPPGLRPGRSDVKVNDAFTPSLHKEIETHQCSHSVVGVLVNVCHSPPDTGHRFSDNRRISRAEPLIGCPQCCWCYKRVCFHRKGYARPCQMMLCPWARHFTLLASRECPCTYCKSLWIRASAKWLNVNVM